MSNDTIKRSDAIDALNECEDIKGHSYTQMHDALMEIPSADRPQGYWATRGKCEFRCSHCGKIIFADCENERNYCPNCGSKNRINLLLKWDDMPLKGVEADDEN